VILIKISALILFFVAAFLIAPTFYALIARMGRRYLQKYRERYITQAEKELDSMFLRISSRQLAYINPGIILLLGVFGLLLTNNILGGIFFALGGVFLFRYIIRSMKQRRLKKFDSQLVDALTLMSNALKAGSSLPQGIKLVVRDMSPPISEEFGLAFRETQVGLSFSQALENLSRRIGSEELELVTRAISIQQETGGKLTEIFDSIVTTIEERNRLEGKVGSLTAQGRMEAITIGVLPWVIAVIFYMIQPELMGIVFRHPLGIAMLIFAVIWEIIGIIMIRKVSTIQV